MPFRCQHDAKKLVFTGPDLRASATVARGKLQPEICNGLLGLERPHAIQYLRRHWKIKIPQTHGRKRLFLTTDNCKLELWFPKAVPRVLEFALRDVFERRQVAGTSTAERAIGQAEVMRKVNASGANRRVPLTGDPELTKEFIRLKSEDPEGFLAALDAFKNPQDNGAVDPPEETAS